MRDSDWLVPSIVLTALSGAVALLLIPSYSGIIPAITMLPMWIIAAVIFTGIYGVFTMMLAGVASPIAHVRKFAVQEWRTAALFAFTMFIAGLNMTTFMWTKPLLNYLVPFWADPILADIDSYIFMGYDPWIFLTELNTRASALFYHRGWFALMILTLVIVLSAPPSPRKSATMLTYFILWSVIGPLIHTLIPAAGPIFFAQMGYGDRFAGLQSVSETREVATYLWDVYSGEGFGPGSGISAMPSMHIATTCWIVMAIHMFSRRLIVPVAIAGVLIFLLSIALGWHYAVDGVVGALATVLCYATLRSLYDIRFREQLRTSAAVS